MTISALDDMESTVFVVSLPSTDNVGIPLVGRVDSSLPFMYIAIDEPLNVASRWVHSSGIELFDSTVCHFMPSNTENTACLVGGMILLTASRNVFSLLITVNCGEPWL